MARSKFFFRASAIFWAALSFTGVAAAFVEDVFSSGEEGEEEAFWLAIGLGLAATILMTILIWSSASLERDLAGGKN